MSKQPAFARNWSQLTYLAIFLLAFIPRVMALDAFVAPDEGKWIYRSAHFLQALQKGDFARATSVAATPAGRSRAWPIISVPFPQPLKKFLSVFIPGLAFPPCC